MFSSNVDFGFQDHQSSLPDVAEPGIGHMLENENLLDNPILNALLTDHKNWALGAGPARRFIPEVGPLCGIPDQSIENYEALRTLAGAGGVLALFFRQPPAPPQGWTMVRGGLLSQMICNAPESEERAPNPPIRTIRQLNAEDVPAMLALTELTEPGPFRTRTHELGKFYGIFESDRLLAMAGQRLSLPGFVEVSAVCTHPDARGRGYARTLMSAVMDDIKQRGRIPFLHVFADNHSAIRVYESLGFTLRRTFHLAVLKNEG
jgi:ribosomal protein S18 acetylase RimI-like enzyme